jgi:hypothetical protein
MRAHHDAELPALVALTAFKQRNSIEKKKNLLKQTYRPMPTQQWRRTNLLCDPGASVGSYVCAHGCLYDASW